MSYRRQNNRKLKGKAKTRDNHCRFPSRVAVHLHTLYSLTVLLFLFGFQCVFVYLGVGDRTEVVPLILKVTALLRFCSHTQHEDRMVISLSPSLTRQE